MEHAAAARRRAPRIVSRICLRRLLPYRSAFRVERAVPYVRRGEPPPRPEGDNGYRHEPLRQRPLVDARHALRGLGTPFPAIYAHQQPLLHQYGPQRLTERSRDTGERLVRPLDARHEPRQPIPAAILQAMGRMVDRICRSGRSACGHLSLQREGAYERVVPGRARGVSRHQYRRRVLDGQHPAAGILAGREREPRRLRLAPALDHGFSAARRHLRGFVERFAA